MLWYGEMMRGIQLDYVVVIQFAVEKLNSCAVVSVTPFPMECSITVAAAPTVLLLASPTYI